MSSFAPVAASEIYNDVPGMTSSDQEPVGKASTHFADLSQKFSVLLGLAILYASYSVAWYLTPDLLKSLPVIAYLCLPISPSSSSHLKVEDSTMVLLDVLLISRSYYYLWNRGLLLDLYERVVWRTDPPHVIALHGTFLSFVALSMWNLSVTSRLLWRCLPWHASDTLHYPRIMTAAARATCTKHPRFFAALVHILQDMTIHYACYSLACDMTPYGLRYSMIVGYVLWKESRVLRRRSIPEAHYMATLFLDAMLTRRSTHSQHDAWSAPSYYQPGLLLDRFPQALLLSNGAWTDFILVLWRNYTLVQLLDSGTSLLLYTQQAIVWQKSGLKDAFLASCRRSCQQSPGGDVGGMSNTCAQPLHTSTSFQDDSPLCLVPGGVCTIPCVQSKGDLAKRARESMARDSLQDGLNVLHDTKATLCDLRKFEIEFKEVITADTATSQSPQIQQYLQRHTHRRTILASGEEYRRVVGTMVVQRLRHASRSRMATANLLICRSDAILAESPTLTGDFDGLRERCEKLMSEIEILAGEVEHFADKCNAAWNEVVEDVQRSWKDRPVWNERIDVQAAR
ncbi:hypothetical protein CERSUDRAFT_98488 [Gelatoporia subvermispora B]|uniref:Uncharacterized protein n=1 Tax=Ceriporiopsis subvermispora (strain B) TaxID=914234 RepID=M2R5D7_CERS8|nr:hypothetical protein CERSUDRAFT_98488 [Gelatoporia subvermispora B]